MTKVINLKELAREPEVVIVTPDGVRHEMVPATVESFIENVTLVENLGTSASVADEMALMIKVITKAFPSITESDVKAWPLEHLQSISELARGQNGELVTTDEAAADEAEASGNG